MSRASTSEIRDAIMARLLSVDGIGRVHAFERFAEDTETLKALYMDGELLHGWHMQRRSLGEFEWTADDNRELAAWHLTGHREIEDASASAVAFDLVIDNIRAVFRSDETLGGLIEQIGNPDTTPHAEAGAQLLSLRTETFCGVQCHQAELVLTTVSLRPLGQPVPETLDSLHGDWDFAEPSSAAGPDGVIDAQTILNTTTSGDEA